MEVFSCIGCVAYDGRMAYRPNHHLADKHGYVRLCDILREDKVCKLVLLKIYLDLRINKLLK